MTAGRRDIGGVRVHFGPGALDLLGDARPRAGRQPRAGGDRPRRPRRRARRPRRSPPWRGRARGGGVRRRRGEPDPHHVEAGRRAAADFGADLLVGLGGGSAMDCAKGINFLLTNGGRMEDYWGAGKASQAHAAVDRRAHDRRHRQRGPVLRPDLASGDPPEDGVRRPQGALPRGHPRSAARRERAAPGGGHGGHRRRLARGREPRHERGRTRSRGCSRGRPGACSRRASREPCRSPDDLRGGRGHAARRAPRRRRDRGLHARRGPRVRQSADRALRHRPRRGRRPDAPPRRALQRRGRRCGSCTATSTAGTWPARIEDLRAAAGLPARLRGLRRRCRQPPRPRRRGVAPVDRRRSTPGRSTRRRCCRSTRRRSDAQGCCSSSRSSPPSWPRLPRRSRPRLDDVPRRPAAHRPRRGRAAGQS